MRLQFNFINTIILSNYQLDWKTFKKYRTVILKIFPIYIPITGYMQISNACDFAYFTIFCVYTYQIKNYIFGEKNYFL